MKVGIFRKKTPRQIHRIKNHLIWISNCREIKEQNKERKFYSEEKEND